MRVLLLLAALSACRDVHVPDLILHDGQRSADGDGSGDSPGDIVGDPFAGDPVAGDPGTPPAGAVYNGTTVIGSGASSGMAAWW